MSVVIKYPGHEVYFNRKHVGYLRKFCCGIDFHHAESRTIFCMLGEKSMVDKTVFENIMAIMNINVPTGRIMNFHHKHTLSVKALIEYQNIINQ